MWNFGVGGVDGQVGRKETGLVDVGNCWGSWGSLALEGEEDI